MAASSYCSTNQFISFDASYYHHCSIWDIKEESDGNRVLTKGLSPAKVLRNFNTSSGHKARKQFWK